ncbi:uncharacterized protein DFL_000063 [Arthrobotrys flagrans]|uniref:Uncharacterized protein n=1 Tax=Arthrobotrys flagrans TaxID=97331 RepID=A0A437AE46_ARTFL|nr:hypothetical protein DFL_000063 [Arthrobotrys flagrans]
MSATTTTTNPQFPTFHPSKFSWADDVEEWEEAHQKAKAKATSDDYLALSLQAVNRVGLHNEALEFCTLRYLFGKARQLSEK